MVAEADRPAAVVDRAATVVAAVAGDGRGDMMAEKEFISAVSDFRRLLRDIEDRYSDAFAELGALQDFKSLIDCVDSFLDLLADPKTDFRVKLMDYAKVKSDVFEFCRCYARWLGSPLMKMLRHEHEIYEILEEAVGWWGRQETCDALEG